MPFISLALRTLYRRAGAAATGWYAGVVNGGPGRRREDVERVAGDRLVELPGERECERGQEERG